MGDFISCCVFIHEFFAFLTSFSRLSPKVVGDQSLAVEVPADACTAVDVSIVAGVPAVPGLPSAVDTYNIYIVSAAIPTVANVLEQL
jgi:hypothetical protein